MLKKILKITGISFLAFFILLLILPFLFKGKIIQIIKDVANQQMTAVVDFDENISLSLIKNFPNVSLGIRHISVIGEAAFEGDTLFYTERFNATLNVASLFGDNPIQVRSIRLQNPVMHLLVTQEGLANWDIMIEDMEDEEEPETTDIEEDSDFAVQIQSLEIQNARILYEDLEMDMKALLVGMNHRLEGDFSLDQFELKTFTDIGQLYYYYEGIPLLAGVKAVAQADMDMDMTQMIFSFSENRFYINDLELHFDGSMQMNDDDMVFDLTFGAVQNEFKHFLSLIPAIYAADLSKMKSSGLLELNGTFQGVMSETQFPGYSFQVGVKNGAFKFDDMPSQISDLDMDFTMHNTSGLDKDLVAHLKLLSFKIDNNPFGAQLLFKNPLFPFVDASMLGSVDLERVAALVPTEEAIEMKGIFNTDMSFSGLIADLETDHWEDFNARGQMNLTNFIFKTPDLPDALSIPVFSMVLSPKQVLLNQFELIMGKTDLSVQGSVTEFFPFVFSDGTLKGNVKLRSQQMDLNAFMESDSEVSQVSETDSEEIVPIDVPALPQNIHFVLDALLEQVWFDTYELKSVQGTMELKEGVLSFINTGMEFLGGNMILNGSYDGSKEGIAHTDMNFKMVGYNIPEAFTALPMFQQYAPFAERVTGFFDLDMSLRTDLDSHLDPVFSSLQGAGRLSLSNAAISNLKLIEELASRFQIQELQNLAIADQVLDFKFDKGRFLVDSVGLPLWRNSYMSLGGYTTPDQGLNYVGYLSLPRKDLGPANQGLEQLLARARSRGVELELEEQVHIALGITGDLTSPNYQFDLKQTMTGLASGLKDQLRDQVTDLIDDKVEEVKERIEDAKDYAREQAQEQADRIMQAATAQADKLNYEAQKRGNQIRYEGKRAADAVRAEADKQAQDLIDRATNPVQRVAAERGAERLRNEAESRAKQIENEAEKRAQSIEQTAKENADRIIADAQKRSDEILSP